MEKVSIIIPIIRENAAARCVEAIYHNAWYPHDHFEIVQQFDSHGIGCPEMVKLLTERTKYDWVMFLGDDTLPKQDFIRQAFEAAKELKGGWGVVGLNTESPGRPNPIAHWMAHKKMLDYIPGGAFFATDYKHGWCDNELRDIADELGRWIFAEHSYIEHIHPVNKTADWDDNYETAYGDDNLKKDRKTYFVRKRERMRENYGVKLAYGEPLTFEMIQTNYHFSAMRSVMNYIMDKYRKAKPIGIEYVAPDFPGYIDKVRNMLVNKALWSGCTHILMTDTDQFTEDENYIDKMLAHNKKVVHAKVHRRYPPFDHILLRGDPDNRVLVPDEEIEAGGLIEIDATGCGCVLYDMSIFTDLEPPWFEDGAEDIKFCNRLRNAGYKIYCDTSIDVKHISKLAVDWGTHKLYKKLRGIKEN